MEQELKSNDYTSNMEVNSEQKSDVEQSPYISVFLRLSLPEKAKAAAKASPEERARPGSFDSAQRLSRAQKNASKAASSDSMETIDVTWTLNMNEFEAASFASTHGSSTPNIHDFSTETDATSEYYSALSVACGTETSGIQSQLGAIWRYATTRTANTGFSFGIPRTVGWKGLREGREEGLGQGRNKGVGRTGKRPAPVPDGMIRAAMEERLEEAQFHPRTPDEKEDRLLSHTGAGSDMRGYDIPHYIQIGDFNMASIE